MSTQPLLPPPILSPPSLPRLVRIEYLDFENVAEHREFRLRVYGPDGSTEVRLRIAIAAFGKGRLRMQDGPDVCYQKLLRIVAAGETVSGEAITVDDSELASYCDAHTQVLKHRTYTASPPFTPASVPRRQPSPQRPIAPLATNDARPQFEDGQRVSHAVFGLGVTTSSSRGHTVVRFDQDGPRTFVTSLLKVDVLSAANTWETGPRETNRPCPALSPRADGVK